MIPAIVLNIVAAFAFSLLLVGRCHRILWTSIVAAILVFTVAVLVATKATHPYFSFGLLFAPWVVWVPVSVAFGSLRRAMADQPPINKWLYVSTVLVVCIVQGMVNDYSTSLPSDSSSIIAILSSLGVVLLTYPAGAIGLAVSLPLIFTGIATITEGNLLAAPVVALAGYLQWFVVFPRLAMRRSGRLALPRGEQ